MTKTSRNVIARTINRTERDLRNKREWRAKLKEISITLKRIWLQRKLKKSDVIFIQLYTTSSWVCSFWITINNNDEIATRRHNIVKTNSKWRIYSNESEKDDEVTTIVVRTNWEYVKRLKNVELTLIHHNEMNDLTMTMKRLIEKYIVENEYKNKIYRVYSNNQRHLRQFDQWSQTTIKHD